MWKKYVIDRIQECIGNYKVYLPDTAIIEPPFNGINMILTDDMEVESVLGKRKINDVVHFNENNIRKEYNKQIKRGYHCTQHFYGIIRDAYYTYIANHNIYPKKMIQKPIKGKCMVCENVFRSQNKLHRHIRRNGHEHDVIKCSHCLETYDTLDELDLHIHFSHKFCV
jgi:hypothetical protein